MTTQMIVRVSPETKEKLARLAKAEGKTNSQIIRELIDQYIQERDITGYIDDLWSRTGNKIRAKGNTERDIAKVISEVRKEGDARSH